MRLIEFFLEPGAWLDVAAAQANYLSSNYTHVARDLAARGVNVIAQLVARRNVDGQPRLSLGSNPDVTLDLLPLLAEARRAGREIATIGVVHAQMPYMYGAAELEPGAFDFVLENPRLDASLFCPPNGQLASVDHAIGLHVSALVRDGGTLQIGIGELGDALCYALLLRHQQNRAWTQALQDAGTERSGAALVDARGRSRAVPRRAVRLHRDVRGPDAGSLPRRHPAAPRLRLAAAVAPDRQRPRGRSLRCAHARGSAARRHRATHRRCAVC